MFVVCNIDDKMMSISLLGKDRAETSFTYYFSRWIYKFDALVCTVVNRGTIIFAQYMNNQLRGIQLQLFPVPTEVKCSLVQNAIEEKISHTYKKHRTRLLGDIEMAWNFTQNSNHDIPHIQHFRTTHWILGQGLENTKQKRISLRELLRLESDQISTTSLIKRDLNPYHRYEKTNHNFTTNWTA